MVSASYLAGVLDYCVGNPHVIIIVIFCQVAIFIYLDTRREFLTAIRRLKSGLGPAPTLPYFLPYVGHAFSVIPSYNKLLTSKAGSNPTLSVYAIKLLGTRHNVVIAPSVTHQVLTGRNIPVHMRELALRVTETVWGDRKKTIRSLDEDFIWTEVHKPISDLMRESFVTSALSITVRGIQDRILNLVSGNDSIVDQSDWERSGKVTYSNPGDSVAVVDLHPLLRDFVGYLAIDAVMGTDFNANYPSALQDIFITESQFQLSMTGLPDWFPALQQPSAARNRLVEAVRQHHIAYAKYAKGEDPGIMWGNIDNSSTVMKDRVLAWEKALEGPNAISEEEMTYAAALGDASIMWALNANANQLIFWLVYYIYADPHLLAQVREEVEPFIRTAQVSKGLPVGAQPDIKIDLDGLRKNCPILQGAFLETMRLEALFSSYKYVAEDFTVTESEEDARIFKHAMPYTYQFKKGEYICMPGYVHQLDARYWDHPEKFDARRFWVKEDSDTKPGHMADFNTKDTDKSPTLAKVDYKTMKTWGGGKELCKGKKFAEGEVVLFTAAIVHFWDMVPVDARGREQKWTHPGSKEGAGATKPASNIKVKLWRRDLSKVERN